MGGTGGSGSGGHVILESALKIDFTDGNPNTLNTVKINARGNPFYTGPKIARDEVPCGVSHGGGGGPGVIQLHVPSLAAPSDDPNASDIVLSSSAAANPGTFGSLWAFTRPPGIQLIPTFGARSKARSEWISLGGADVDTAGGAKLLEFMFEGIETTPGPDFGKILTDGNGNVLELPPLIGPEAMSSGTLAVLSDGSSVRVTGASLANLLDPSGDLYLRTPALLKNFVVRLNEIGNVSNARSFDVATASYDDAGEALTLTVVPVGGNLQDFLDLTPNSELTLIPRFFRAKTDGIVDRLPESAFVRVTFDGAADNGAGEPDLTSLLVDHGSAADFNALTPGELQFFRFEVEFNLDALSSGLSVDTKPIELDFLRLPFRF